MQTMYYQTENFIRSEGNVIDFETYRRKAARMAVELTEEALPQRAPAQAAVRRRRQTQIPALVLDWLISAAILVMTVSATIHFLAL